MHTMKKRILPIATMTAGLLSAGLCSCSKADDILHSLDKLEYESYLCNKSGQDVTVCFFSPTWGAAGQTYAVPKGAVVEIPDTERWHLCQRANATDSVVFTFADGKRLVHRYVNPNYGQSDGPYSYIPQDNNIWRIGITVPDDEQTWTLSKIQPKKYRYDYIIR